MTKQQIRIIGGKFKGKKISFPAITGLRPTPDRVRETLFNWLMNRITGTRCLDAFAGSGALGFEAFSRGAKEVVFIEESSLAYKNIRQLANEFNLGSLNNAENQPSLKVTHNDFEQYLKTNVEPFDIIFLDPPFTQQKHLHYLNLIQTNNILKPDGLLYVEAPCLLTLDSLSFKIQKSKRAGNVYYSLLSFAT